MHHSRLSVYIIALGMGGIKSCVTPFGADQFEPGEEAGRDSFFNWSYGAVCLGSIIGTIAIVFILEGIGWGIGYGVCAAAFAGGLVIFVLGWGWYKKVGIFVPWIGWYGAGTRR
jgi:peptide/histidine transporter 3/4